MQDSRRPKPVILIILDGWGAAPEGPGNAIVQAETPNFDLFLKKYFVTTLQASGEAVGLKWGEMGNSEVGHLNIGAGRVVYQPQPRIDKEIIDGTFFSNEILMSAFGRARERNSRVHILGLASDTGVHATIEHCYALLEMAKANNINNVYIHPILDGRDSEYNSGAKFVSHILDKTRQLGVGKIASISGRYWAMDRDNRWERIARAYDAIVNGNSSVTFDDPIDAIRASYRNNIFDEEFEPAVSSAIPEDERGMLKGDVVIFYNFRADRARQMSHAIYNNAFNKFERPRGCFDLTTFTEYDSKLKSPVAFPVEHVKTPLARVISDAGLSQLHIAETEKYAHVTYFFNGGREDAFMNEDRVLIPSPPGDTYESVPQMSAHHITDRVVQEINQNIYDFYVVNFANADMIGHTGNFSATLKAVQVIDECLGHIYEPVKKAGGVMIVTADHGNAEGMVHTVTGEIDKGHSARPVPFVIVGSDFERSAPLQNVPNLSAATSGGLLSDIAPTVLNIMKLKIPDEMTGVSLV